jgi:hypothetical protein
VGSFAVVTGLGQPVANLVDRIVTRKSPSCSNEGIPSEIVCVIETVGINVILDAHARVRPEIDVALTTFAVLEWFLLLGSVTELGHVGVRVRVLDIERSKSGSSHRRPPQDGEDDLIPTRVLVAGEMVKNRLGTSGPEFDVFRLASIGEFRGVKLLCDPIVDRLDISPVSEGLSHRRELLLERDRSDLRLSPRDEL